LKQSQSSNFFSNSKNKGKEDFDDVYEKTTKASSSVKSTKARGRNRGRSKYKNSNAITSSPIKSNVATQKPVTTFTTPIVVQPISNERTSQGPRIETSTQHHHASNFRSFPSSTLAPIQSSSALPQPRKIDETFFDVPKAIPKQSQAAKLQSAPVQQNFNQQQPSTVKPPQAPPRLETNPFAFFGAIPQRVIIPSQLSPEQRLALQQSNGKSLQLQSSSTVAPSQQFSSSQGPQTSPQNRLSPNPNQIQTQKTQQQKDIGTLPQKFNFKTQKYEPVEPANPTTQFYNPKYETKGTEQPPYNTNINYDSTRDTLRQINRTTSQRQLTHDEHKPTTFNPQQYYQSEQSQFQTLTPRGFSIAAKQQQTQQVKSTPAQIDNKQQKINSRAEIIRNHKKFSTLVPKDQYYPTTFKPANGAFNKKPIDTVSSQKLEKIQQSNKFFAQSTTLAPVTQSFITSPLPQYNNNALNTQYQQQQQPQQNINFDQQSSRVNNFYSTSSTPRPLNENEEDDGQYRPELYEKDFYRNKIKTTKIAPVSVNNNVHQSTSKPIHNSFAGEEDELFKTAHSQNIFASGNQLRAEKEREKTVSKVAIDYSQFTEKSSPRPFSKPTPPATVKPTTSKKPVKQKSKTGAEKDVSYDYQYYDTDTNLNDYTDLETIEDFGKTVKKTKKQN
jgi:hypothetical protein